MMTMFLIAVDVVSLWMKKNLQKIECLDPNPIPVLYQRVLRRHGPRHPVLHALLVPVIGLIQLILILLTVLGEVLHYLHNGEVI